MRDAPIVVFDGACNLCCGSARFIARRDGGRFRLVPYQSEEGRRLLATRGLPTDEPQTVWVLEGDRAFGKSAAALRIVKGLRWPWRALHALVIVPRPVRDWAYDVVSRHRAEWFGRARRCDLPERRP